MPFENELAIALRIAKEAGEIALRYQAQGVSPESKSDLSPVTIADRECEALIVKRLHEAFPEDGLMGEEGAFHESRSGRRWIIDPIDGTRDFVRNNPRWAVLLALETAKDKIAVGVTHFPAADETFHAVAGGGAYRGGTRMQASAVTQLQQAVACVNGLIAIRKAPYAERLFDFMGKCFAIRSLGGAPDAMMLAQGQADIWLEPTCKPWDLAPLKVIFAEAGVRMFTYGGDPTIYGDHWVACTPGLEATVRDFVGAPALTSS